MFTHAKFELQELMKLTHELATLDATLAARPDIIPADGYMAKRTSIENRKIELAQKYELL
jgi:hypothetical protein